jgi:glycosyltransferase involved in cell wall biosynthesis
VVPCYRSGAWLDELAARIDASTAEWAGRRELILIDDASPDAVTWPAIVEVASKRAWVRGVAMHFNVGQYRAILAGLSRARGDWVVMLDDDFQTPPEEIQRLIDGASRNPEADAIIGAYETKRHPFARNLGTRLVRALYGRLSSKPPGLQSTSFRLLRRNLVDVLLSYDTARPMLGAMVFESSTRIVNVPVDHQARAHGRSNYTPAALLELVLDYLLSSSTAPLRGITGFGLLAAAGSFAFGAFTFARWATGAIEVPGFTTLALLLAFATGSTLLSIGIVGEYVRRVLVEVLGRPRWAVRAEVGGEALPRPPR